MELAVDNPLRPIVPDDYRLMSEDPSGNREKLLKCLGHSFNNPDLLEEALTHPSATTRKSTRLGEGRDYDRLEFLGDRVLGLVIADHLLEIYPKADSGRLATRYNALVRRETLAQIAEEIELGPQIRFARGERNSGGSAKPALLADVCEAVIAALYLDGGLEAAARFIHRYWDKLADELTTAPKDAKTRLQELAHARSVPAPVYRETGRDGPPHAPVFTIEVEVGKLGRAKGGGSSKRAAEQIAAEELYNQIMKGA
jgi:ribonuclease III